MKHTETPYPPITAGDCAVIYGPGPGARGRS